MRFIVTRFDSFTNEKLQHPIIIEAKQRIGHDKQYAFRVFWMGRRHVMWQSAIEQMIGMCITDKQLRKIPTVSYITG